MEIIIRFLWLVYLTFNAVQAEYDPVLSWDVCSPSRIVVTLTGGQDGGIIYIRGYGAACRQATSANQTQHVFDFQACGIVTGETYFTVIVQKNPLYQTGEDLQESLLCIYDLGDITVGNNVNTGDKNDDAGINKTIKPTGRMVLYKDGVDIGGQNVKLTDLVTMTIQLDEEFVDDFDIKARSCTANFIDLIQNLCAEDTTLFPNFQHPTQGVITSSFSAFRTTDLGGGYVEMIFSCTIQVCKGLCSQEACSDNEEGWGRRRRAVSDVKYDILSIGASFSVGTDRDVMTVGPESMNSICIDNTVFILLLLALLGVLVTSLSLVVHVTTKLLKRNDELQNLTGINCRQRKSLMQVIKGHRRTSSPTMHLGFNQSKLATVSRGPLDKEAVKADNIDLADAKKDTSRFRDMEVDKLSVKPKTDKRQMDTSFRQRNNESLCNPEVLSLPASKGAVHIKPSSTAGNQRVQNFSQHITVLGCISPKTEEDNILNVGNHFGFSPPNSKQMHSLSPNSTIAGSSEVDADINTRMDNQLAFCASDSKPMSKTGKEKKIREYHALLQRFAQTDIWKQKERLSINIDLDASP